MLRQADYFSFIEPHMSRTIIKFFKRLAFLVLFEKQHYPGNFVIQLTIQRFHANLPARLFQSP